MLLILHHWLVVARNRPKCRACWSTPDRAGGPAMTTYTGTHHKGGQSVRHSKADALPEREFELLFESAGNLSDYYGIQAQFAVLVLGRLGLRRGELAHMDASWLNTRDSMISIPAQDTCHGERDGDGPCGYCRRLAKEQAQRAEHVSFQDRLGKQWQPKTDAAARDVYYGFSARVEMYVERFFERFDSWTWSAQAVNRRIDKAAEEVDLNVRITPHTLRATAATFHASRGLEMHALMQHFGWCQPSTAKVYLARNGKNTARQLDAIHSR